MIAGIDMLFITNNKFKEMKKKIIFGIAACLFAVATMFNIGRAQQGNISDISLLNIAVMTQAYAENDMCPKGCYAGGDGCICNGWHPENHEAS